MKEIANDIEAIFFDVDGTLVSPATHMIPNSTIEAIEAVRAKGIKCYIATGRHMSELDEMGITDMAMDGYVTTNGQIVLDGDRHIIASFPFPKDIQDSLVEVFDKKEVPLLLVEADRIYHNMIDERVIRAFGPLGTAIPEVSEYRGDPVYTACTYIDHGDTDYKKHFPDGLSFMWWHNDAVDIVANAGKITGIRALCDHYGHDIAKTMAFGDAENDRAMLEEVGVAVVMGDGDEDIKRLADYVTASADQDGIAKALRYFGLV